MIKRRRLFGFTLMELIMVMLIISILAIVAAPRFLSVQDQAYLQVRKSMIMNMNSALDMGAVKAALEGVTSGQVTIDDEDAVCIKDSYPTVSAGDNCGNFLILMKPVPVELSLANIGGTVAGNNYSDGTIVSDNITGDSIASSNQLKQLKKLDTQSILLQVGNEDCKIAVHKADNTAKPTIFPVGNCD